jgi:hypothetical protein
VSANFINYNIIGPEVQRNKNPAGFDWSKEASENLAASLAKKINPLSLNIRYIQPGDNLGRIAEGLSLREITVEKWGEIRAEYKGDSDEIRKQIQQNLSCTLKEASLIYPGQYVRLQGRTVMVGATLGDLSLN